MSGRCCLNNVFLRHPDRIDITCHPVFSRLPSFCACKLENIDCLLPVFRVILGEGCATVNPARWEETLAYAQTQRNRPVRGRPNVRISRSGRLRCSLRKYGIGRQNRHVMRRQVAIVLYRKRSMPNRRTGREPESRKPVAQQQTRR